MQNEIITYVCMLFKLLSIDYCVCSLEKSLVSRNLNVFSYDCDMNKYKLMIQNTSIKLGKLFSVPKWSGSLFHRVAAAN